MKKRHGSWVIMLLAMSRMSLTQAADEVDIDTVQKAMYVSMLLNSNQRDARLAATGIRKFYPADERLRDLVAEQLAHAIEPQLDPHAIRTIKTYVDTLSLADSRRSRYRTLLLHTREKTDNGSLIHQITQILSTTDKATASEFVPGQIDVEQQRSAAMQILSNGIRTNHSQFKQLGQGMKFEEVLKTLGVPDLIHSRGHRIQLLELNYKNAGLVVLGVDNSGKPTWVVNYTAPEWMSVSDFYDDKNFAIAQNLVGLDGRALAQYYKTESRGINSDMRLVCLYVRRLVQQSRRPYPYETKMANNALHHLTLASHPCAADSLKLATRSGYDDLSTLAKKSMAQRDQWIAQGKPLKDQRNDVNGNDGAQEEHADMDDGDDDDDETSGK